MIKSKALKTWKSGFLGMNKKAIFSPIVDAVLAVIFLIVIIIMLYYFRENIFRLIDKIF